MGLLKESSLPPCSYDSHPFYRIDLHASACVTTITLFFIEGRALQNKAFVTLSMESSVDATRGRSFIYDFRFASPGAKAPSLYNSRILLWFWQHSCASLLQATKQKYPA